MYEVQASGGAARPKRWGEWAAVAILLMGFALYGALTLNGWMAVHLPTAICQVALLAAAFPGFVLRRFTYPGLLQRLFEWSPLRWLGDMSYFYYLTHGLALQGLNLAAKYLIPPGIHAALWLALLVAMPIAWVVSTVLFVVVEKPLSLHPRWGRRPALPRGPKSSRAASTRQSPEFRAGWLRFAG